MPGSDYIDGAWVRLGIGHESLDSIISALRFSLDAARDDRKAALMPSIPFVPKRPAVPNPWIIFA